MKRGQSKSPDCSIDATGNSISKHKKQQKLVAALHVGPAREYPLTGAENDAESQTSGNNNFTTNLNRLKQYLI
jgi:hypothetical protein